MLCQIELLACVGFLQPLLGLAMQRMLSATLTILLEFQTTRVISTVFLGRVISFLAFGAFQGNDWANIFLSHILISAPI